MSKVVLFCYITWPTHTRKVQRLHGIVVAPVLAIGNVVDVPRCSEQDPVASFGDSAEFCRIRSGEALPDVQHCVLRNLRRVTTTTVLLLVCYIAQVFFCMLNPVE